MRVYKFYLRLLAFLRLVYRPYYETRIAPDLAWTIAKIIYPDGDKLTCMD